MLRTGFIKWVFKQKKQTIDRATSIITTSIINENYIMKKRTQNKKLKSKDKKKIAQWEANQFHLHNQPISLQTTQEEGLHKKESLSNPCFTIESATLFPSLGV